MPKPKTDALGRPMQYIYRHPSHLAGLSHRNKNGRDRVRLARSLRIGTQLDLRLDPDNPADQDAVLVFRADDAVDDLGYLYSYTARSVARKIRCGATFSAAVYGIENTDDRYPVYRLYAYQLTKTTEKEPKRPPEEYYRHATYVYGECVQETRLAPRLPDTRQPIQSSEPIDLSIEPVHRSMGRSAGRIFRRLKFW